MAGYTFCRVILRQVTSHGRLHHRKVILQNRYITSVSYSRIYFDRAYSARSIMAGYVMAGYMTAEHIAANV